MSVFLLVLANIIVFMAFCVTSIVLTFSFIGVFTEAWQTKNGKECVEFFLVSGAILFVLFCVQFAAQHGGTLAQ